MLMHIPDSIRNPEDFVNHPDLTGVISGHFSGSRKGTNVGRFPGSPVSITVLVLRFECHEL